MLLDMKFFELNIAQMLIRYYLMMMVIIIAGFSGQWWLAGLSLFIFLSALMGAQWSKTKETTKKTKVVQLSEELRELRKAS